MADSATLYILSFFFFFCLWLAFCMVASCVTVYLCRAVQNNGNPAYENPHLRVVPVDGGEAADGAGAHIDEIVLYESGEHLGKASVSGDSDPECVICMDAAPNVIFDCGHANVCVTCARKITKCPMCRAAINSRIVRVPKPIGSSSSSSSTSGSIWTSSSSASGRPAGRKRGRKANGRSSTKGKKGKKSKGRRGRGDTGRKHASKAKAKRGGKKSGTAVQAAPGGVSASGSGKANPASSSSDWTYVASSSGSASRSGPVAQRSVPSQQRNGGKGGKKSRRR